MRICNPARMAHQELYHGYIFGLFRLNGVQHKNKLHIKSVALRLDGITQIYSHGTTPGEPSLQDCICAKLKSSKLHVQRVATFLTSKVIRKDLMHPSKND